MVAEQDNAVAGAGIPPPRYGRWHPLGEEAYLWAIGFVIVFLSGGTALALVLITTWPHWHLY